MELSERKKKILSSVTEHYIMTGEPLGSKQLCGGLSVSSATVRNDMSELSDMGYLEQPYTSAGRIPSQKGLRYYVNNLMAAYEISDSERFSVIHRFDSLDGEPDEIIKAALKLLSEVTGCASAALTPYDSDAVIKRAELVPLGSKTCLVVVLVSTGIIKSRICRLYEPCDIETAQLFYNIAADRFIGRRPSELTAAEIQTIAASLGEKSFVMIPLLVTLSELSLEAAKYSVITEGHSRLLGYKELDASVYGILEYMKRESELARMLNSGKNDLTVYIGSDCMSRALENSSVISSKYSVCGKRVGALGIIGPLRMDYARVIPNLTFVSETVGRVISETID